MALLAFRDRPLNADELEILRLTLSSFRDGSGQVVRPSGGTMPGFRDYERSLAAVLGGTTPEGMGIFDVLIPSDTLPIGVSCKMTGSRPAAHSSSFMELSNALAAFRKCLLDLQINWVTEPMLAGPALVDLVMSWHQDVAEAIDLSGSRYAVLSHDHSWKKFQILCYKLNLKVVNPRGDVDWVREGASLNGYMDDEGRRHRLWQFYLNSGGQLKYYPLFSWAEWITEPFELENAPLVSPLAKAQEYFGDIWPRA